MLELCTLASGSSGNCLLVTDGRTHLLVDAGISCRRICTGLKALSIDPAQLAGILITHEHSDHIAGLKTLTKRFPVPLFATVGTVQQLCHRLPGVADRMRTLPKQPFSVGSMTVASFPTPHDNCDSVGYTISSGGRKAAVVTDLGRVTPEVATGIWGAHLLVGETNHEVAWVEDGPYPRNLKRRILGDYGHLSNEAGAALACTAVKGGARTVLLAHLSRENNTPQRAYETVSARLTQIGAKVGRDVTLEVAPRSELSRRYLV